MPNVRLPAKSVWNFSANGKFKSNSNRLGKLYWIDVNSLKVTIQHFHHIHPIGILLTITASTSGIHTESIMLAILPRGPALSHVPSPAPPACVKVTALSPPHSPGSLTVALSLHADRGLRPPRSPARGLRAPLAAVPPCLPVSSSERSLWKTKLLLPGP